MCFLNHRDEWSMREAGDEDGPKRHREQSLESRFYQAVAEGDVEAVREDCRLARFTEREGVGVLSRDPVTNLKYHFVITAAMVTRLCVQGGMEMEQAYRLSDFYIQKLDDIRTEDGVHILHDEMVVDFAEKMRRLRRADTDSRHVNACKDYIYAHIRERITVADLAEETGLSAGYLSRLFKKQTGESVSAYIRGQKIAVAKNLLRFSDYPMADIAARLAFSSQSHFIQQFREQEGMTPKEYRDTHYMLQWELEKD